MNNLKVNINNNVEEFKLNNSQTSQTSQSSQTRIYEIIKHRNFPQNNDPPITKNDDVRLQSYNIINNDLSLNNNNGWWFPSKNGKKRILWAGTHILQSNGYSRVMYYITKYLGKYEDIELTIYGFQNFNTCEFQKNLRNEISESVIIYDAYANEDPKRNGFGEKEIGNYIKNHPQDIIIIFNDAMITSAITADIVNNCWDQKHNFKLISYMDQVYIYQKQEYINLLNTYYDSIIAFTPYWKEIAYKLGIKKEMNIHIFPHGFDHNLYYPIDKKIARIYYNYDMNDFMVLNLNRNQPRKRWDTTMMAWAEFVNRHYQVNVLKKNLGGNKHTTRQIKLIVGTEMSAHWDLLDVFVHYLKNLEVPLEYAIKTIIPLKAPQQLSDRDINILYNCCDVGLNTADGEGFGLCGFEGLAVGRAQVSSYVGGMREFLNDNISILIKPKVNIYLDNKSNGIGGVAEICDPIEFADAFWKYFSNPELMNKHATRGRQHILTNYRWESMVEHLYKNIIPKL
jgi:glycosyltransferase involved in cell wall biosynthesis